MNLENANLEKPVKIAHFDGRYGFVAIFDGDNLRLITTLPFSPGGYVHIDDSDKGNSSFSELCYGAHVRGSTMNWSRSDDAAVIAKQFARDCGARLYKTRKKFDAAVALMSEEAAY